MFHFNSNTGYYAKSLCLALAMGLLFVLACGDDEQQPDLMMPEPPSLSEELVGSWEIVSIDGETLEVRAKEKSVALEERIKEDFVDEFGVDWLVNRLLAATNVDIEVFKNEFVFAANSSVFVNVARRYIFEGIHAGTKTIHITWKGTYIVSGSTLTIVWEERNTILEPEDFWASIGVTAKKSVNLGFEIKNNDIDLSGDTLTITDDTGVKMVLTKR